MEKHPNFELKSYAVCYQGKIALKPDFDPRAGNIENFIKPTNVFFVFKLGNGGKLHSHLWFLNGFCSELNPDYISLLDGGTMPFE